MTKLATDKDSNARLEEALARCGARDRAAIERHLALCAQTNPDHVRLWRRLAATLFELAPLPIRTVGSQAITFFVADGKYRMQVFALEDNRNGVIELYLPNVLPLATREKIVVKGDEGYVVGSAKKQKIAIQAMDTTNTPDPAPHVKHMLGWNRKAMKITLDVADPDGPQVAAAEALFASAGRQWATAIVGA